MLTAWQAGMCVPQPFDISNGLRHKVNFTEDDLTENDRRLIATHRKIRIANFNNYAVVGLL